MELCRKDIVNFIGEPYLSRGEQYFNDGMIQLLTVKKHIVSAKAFGSRIYSVTLKFQNFQLMGECSCPAFQDYGPCKHIAATGFAVIEHQSGRYKESEECLDRIDEHSNFEKLLRKKTKKELILLILNFSEDYPEIKYEFEYDL